MLPTSAAQIIVCERSNHWAVALRWAVATCSRHSREANSREAIQILESRSLHACWQRLRESPASLVAIDVQAAISAAELATEIALVPSAFPRATVVILGREVAGETGWRLRQLGAVHVVATPRSVETLIGILRRHRKVFPASPSGFRGEVWQKLPWGDVAQENRNRPH